MDNRNVFYQQPNELQEMELKIWKSSEFQIYLLNQVGSDRYGQELRDMNTDTMKQYIKKFLIQQDEAREKARIEKEETAKLLYNPTLVDVNPVEYLGNSSFQNDIKLITSDSTEGLEDAYKRLRGFLEKLLTLAATMSIQEAQTYLTALNLVTKEQLKQIGLNKNASSIKATTPSKFNLAVRNLNTRLESKEETREEKRQVIQLPSSDEAMQTAQTRFFQIAEHGILTGQDRKRLKVGATESVDAKNTISSVIASEELSVNIILSTRQENPAIILSTQLDDDAKGWLSIALEDPDISIEDLYQKGASAEELRAVCQHRALNTIICVMTVYSLTNDNAIVGSGPSRLKTLIADREIPSNPRTSAKNRDLVHECPIPSSIHPKGFVAILIPEALMGIAAVVAKYFSRQGFNVSFYVVGTTSYDKKRGKLNWSFKGPNYNSVLAELCLLKKFEKQPVIFHLVRLR